MIKATAQPCDLYKLFYKRVIHYDFVKNYAQFLVYHASLIDFLGCKHRLQFTNCIFYKELQYERTSTDTPPKNGNVK